MSLFKLKIYIELTSDIKIVVKRKLKIRFICFR